MNREYTLNAQKVEALLTMLTESGASAAGQLPSAKYLDAIRRVEEPGRADEVAAAHREGRGPPDNAGNGGGA